VGSHALSRTFSPVAVRATNLRVETKALNLAGGDQSGSWMLNYAFPYDNKQVQEQFSVLSRLLADAVRAKGQQDRKTKLVTYLQMRRGFQQMLNPDDYKYLSFQLWQEGVAVTPSTAWRNWPLPNTGRARNLAH